MAADDVMVADPVKTGNAADEVKATKPKRERKPRVAKAPKAPKAPKAVKRPVLGDGCDGCNDGCVGNCTPRTARMGQQVAFWLSRGGLELRPTVGWIDGYSELSKTWRLLTLSGSLIVPQTDVPYSEKPANCCWTFCDQVAEMAVAPLPPLPSAPPAPAPAPGLPLPL